MRSCFNAIVRHYPALLGRCIDLLALLAVRATDARGTSWAKQVNALAGLKQLCLGRVQPQMLLNELLA